MDSHGEVVAEAWRKLGLVLEPTGEGLQHSHAMLPTPHVLSDRIRVFYAACDSDMRGRTFYADFDPEPPFRIIARSRNPVLDLGPPGAFDCDGVNPSQAFVADGRLVLLYIGWRRGPAETPYTLFGAAAFSDDDGETFETAGEPLLAPRSGERLFRTAPFIERRTDGYRLLYIGGDAFLTAEDGRRLPVYSLKELAGKTLWDWDGHPSTLMSPDLGAGELGFGRPTPFDGPDGAPRLMLSVRTQDGYQLMEMDRNFACEARPRMDAVVPQPRQTWERRMTCFGAPCLVGDYELLFYNGDGYGRAGTGLAWRARRRPDDQQAMHDAPRG
jgi:hypothetical protein